MSRGEEEIERMLREIPDAEPEGEHVDDRDLIAYARDKLDASQRAAVERHLTSCAECRALAADYAEPIAKDLTAFAKDTLRSNRRSRWPAVATIAVAAAALLFVFLPRPGAGPTLPTFSVDAPLGGVATMRGADDGTSVFVPTSRVRWLLRPSSSLDTSAKLRVFVSPLGEPDRITELPDPKFERGASGIIRFEATAEALFGEAFGTRTVHFVVVPEDEDTRAYSGPRDAISIGPHQWLTSRIEYQPRAPKEETP